MAIRKGDHPATRLSYDEARQGIELGHMRYVLGISLMLAVMAGVFLWLTFFS